MNLKEKSIAMAKEIKNDPKWKKHGTVVADLLAIIFSFLPPASVAIDKIEKRFLEEDPNKKIHKLADMIQLLAPEVERLESIEAQIDAIYILLHKNQSLFDVLNEMCQMMNSSSPREFHVHTDSSLQEFVRVVVRDMNVKIEAHNNGRNLLYRFKTSGGDTQFYSTSGGTQRVYDSEFEGKSGGKVGMNNIGIEGPIRTFDNEKGSGVGFGSGGKIVFGPGGRLSFGKNKNPKTGGE